MAWRDWLRRRAAADGPSGAVGPSPDQSAPGGPGSSVPGDPGPSVPGDWDGGWRRTAAPELTVSRAPLGVSDGLAFRAGLAAWQNPSFDRGLGHALLPVAPAGLVHGVTRPAAPRPTHTAGGPLLLGALRPQGADGSQAGTPDAGTPDARTAAPAPQDVRRTGPADRKSGSAAREPGSSAVRPSGGVLDDNGVTGKGRSRDDAPRTRGLTPSDSPAVLSPSAPTERRAALRDTGPLVAPADTGSRPAVPTTPLLRRVAVVPPAVADGAASGAAPETRSGAAGANPGRPKRHRGSDGNSARPLRRRGVPPRRPACRDGGDRARAHPAGRAVGGVPCFQPGRGPTGSPAQPIGASTDHRPTPGRTRAPCRRGAALDHRGARHPHDFRRPRYGSTVPYERGLHRPRTAHRHIRGQPPAHRCPTEPTACHGDVVGPGHLNDRCRDHVRPDAARRPAPGRDPGTVRRRCERCEGNGTRRAGRRPPSDLRPRRRRRTRARRPGRAPARAAAERRAARWRRVRCPRLPYGDRPGRPARTGTSGPEPRNRSGAARRCRAPRAGSGRPAAGGGRRPAPPHGRLLHGEHRQSGSRGPRERACQATGHAAPGRRGRPPGAGGRRSHGGRGGTPATPRHDVRRDGRQGIGLRQATVRRPRLPGPGGRGQGRVLRDRR